MSAHSQLGKCSAPYQRGIPLTISTTGYTMHLVPLSNSQNRLRSSLCSSLDTIPVQSTTHTHYPTPYQSMSDRSSIHWYSIVIVSTDLSNSKIYLGAPWKTTEYSQSTIYSVNHQVNDRIRKEGQLCACLPSHLLYLCRAWCDASGV